MQSRLGSRRPIGSAEVNGSRARARRFIDPSNASNECDSLLVSFIEQVHRDVSRPAIIGLGGPQGSGKSTSANRIAAKLRLGGYAVAVLSFDDFYHTRAKRLELARTAHPLLITRGVPGTHEVELAHECLAGLCSGVARRPVLVPRFDKLADDRKEKSAWFVITRPVQIILLEGWCVGARPQAERHLNEPLNALERKEDRDGRWRRFVNAQLEGPYHQLFGRLDALIAFRAPFFDVVASWRAEQEAKMAASRHARPMAASDLHRFISHFERLTRWMDEHPSADVLIDLDEQRRPLEYSYLNAPRADAVGPAASGLGKPVS